MTCNLSSVLSFSKPNKVLKNSTNMQAHVASMKNMRNGSVF